jgi:hypothetical protein
MVENYLRSGHENTEKHENYGADVDIKDHDGKKAEDYASGEIASLFD